MPEPGQIIGSPTPLSPIGRTPPQYKDKVATPAECLPVRPSCVLAHRWAFILLVCACILPGLVGHQPWKQDETYIIAIVRSMLDTHDFVVPTMAGEPFMEKPPLYYWVAAACAKLLTPALAFHDAARLATGFFMLLTCAALAYCGRQWRGQAFGRAAVLVLLGCVGLQVYAHLMLTDIALLAGIAVGFAGVPLCKREPVKGGWIVGTGVGIGFLAKGLLAPGLFATSALVLVLCFKSWRRASCLRAACITVLAALPWLLIWPSMLYWRSPSLFSDWFWLNNVGRFLGFAVPILGAAHDDGFWSKNLWWITLPAGPLAILTVWRARRALRDDDMLQACVAFAAVTWGVLLVSASARGGYALPLLVPVAMLGADSALALSARQERGWRLSAQLCFTAFALLIWLAWASVTFSVSGAGLAFLRGQLAPSLDRHIDAALVLLAVLATLAAAWLIWHPARQLALQTWTTGVALCCTLLALLFMPWVDQVKSYREVFATLHAALPAQMDCVASDGLGESERAMLSYYHGIITRRLELQPRAGCRVVLVEGWAALPPAAVDPRAWKMVWQGARPADTDERFWLYVRQSDAPVAAAAMPRAKRSPP